MSDNEIDYDSIIDNIGKEEKTIVHWTIPKDDVESINTQELIDRGLISPVDGNITGCIKSGSGKVTTIGSGIIANDTFSFDAEVTKEQLGVDKVQSIVDMASNLIVETDEEVHKAASIAISAKQTSSDITKERKRITDPALQFQKHCIALEKEYTSKLYVIEKSLLSKIEEYKTSRAIALEQVNISDGHLDVIESNNGKISVSESWEFDIEDTSLVPSEYLIVDEKKIKDDIKKGIRKITGVKIYKKKSVKTRITKQKAGKTI